MVNIRKRGKVYQYQFEIAKVDGKRKYISKSGFKTKNETLMAGMKAYDEYINGDNTKDSQMSYADYLESDLDKMFCYNWLKNWKSIQLPKDNKNIFSSNYKLHLPTEQELIDAVEEKKNLELNE